MHGFINTVIFFAIFFSLMWISTLFEKYSEKNGASPASDFAAKAFGSISMFWLYGGMLYLAFSLIGPFLGLYEDDGGYSDNTPSEWGPGYDSGGTNDVHEVDGYYNNNGTYVEPYMRSDPDSFESNNINP